MRKTQECRPGKGKKPSRKLGSPCISRMYCTREPGGCVRVQYIQTHTNHNLSIGELKHMPLPAGTKQKVAMQLSKGVPIPRILEGTLMYTD